MDYPLAPTIFVNHGGGPLPLLDDEDHRPIGVFLRDQLKKHFNVQEAKAIILVTAHWEENIVTISSSERHDLYFDYYGFPPESYHYKYPAAGDSALAKRIHNALQKEDIPSRLDANRGWDHGVFIPMMLINPSADITIVQISILNSQDAGEHFKIGEVLSQFRKEGVTIIGSGMSYHNMKVLRATQGSNNSGVVNEEFDNYLMDTCTADEEKRRQGFLRWRDQSGASQCFVPGHGSHFMPLIVVAGAGRNGKAERIFNLDYLNKFRLSGFLWRGE